MVMRAADCMSKWVPHIAWGGGNLHCCHSTLPPSHHYSHPTTAAWYAYTHLHSTHPLVHVQVLVRLCYVLPAPACYIYRDMRPGTMQRVLAQRAALEKQLRGHLVELVWLQQQVQGWVKQVRVVLESESESERESRVREG